MFHFLKYAYDAKIVIKGNGIALLRSMHSFVIYVNHYLNGFTAMDYALIYIKNTWYFLAQEKLNILVQYWYLIYWLTKVWGEISRCNCWWILNWSRHVKTARSKMARYLRLMYKLKRQLPVAVRIQIYHSFVVTY